MTLASFSRGLGAKNSGQMAQSSTKNNQKNWSFLVVHRPKVALTKPGDAVEGGLEIPAALDVDALFAKAGPLKTKAEKKSNIEAQHGKSK